jgi:hypothetical protein
MIPGHLKPTANSTTLTDVIDVILQNTAQFRRIGKGRQRQSGSVATTFRAARNTATEWLRVIGGP